jgi:hypothetical protein
MPVDYICLQLDDRSKDNAESFGMKFSPGGVHQRRTMMLEEISALLQIGASTNLSIDEYKTAVIERNVLGKKTDSTRRETFKHLKELYLLSNSRELFASYRSFVLLDPESAPLLSLLAAWCRDPLLREATDVVIHARVGSEVPIGLFRTVIEMTTQGRFSEKTIHSTAGNIASTWTQSGHLVGKVKKIRQMVQPRPAALVFALYLARATRIDGERLFSSIWCRLLDLSASQAREMASMAHRQGLLTLKAIGSTVEVSFPRFESMHGGTA